MESGLGTVVLIDVSAKHVNASDVYLRNIELLVLRLLTYHQHSAGHSKWGFSFFESECAGGQSRREPGRKPQHEFSSQSFHTFSKNLRKNTRGKTAERYLSVRDVDGCADAGSVTTSASATPSALSAAGGTHGHTYAAQQEPAPRQPLSKSTSTLSRAQRITHALKDALGDYEWEPPPSSKMPRSRGAGEEGSAGGLRTNNVLLVISPCPRDGTSLEDFIRPSSPLEADADGSSAHSSVRDKELSNLLDTTMQRASLCDAYRKKGIILGWIDTACVLSQIMHSSGPHDLSVGGFPSVHMRRFIESFGGRIMGMHHLLYGSSALPFALRYETALNLAPLDAQSAARLPPSRHMGCLAGLNLPRHRGACVLEPSGWDLAANLQIRPLTAEITKKCEEVASKTGSDVVQTSVQILCMVRRADVTPLWFEMNHVYWCQDVTRTLSGNSNDAGTFSKMLVDLMGKGLVLRVRVTQGECSFEAILFPLTSCLAGLQVLKHTGHEVCDSPSRARATPARARRHSPDHMRLEEAEALLRSDLLGRQAGASARRAGGGSVGAAGRGRFVLKMSTAISCPLDAEDAWDSMMIAAEDEDALASSGNGTGENARSSREASAASAELPHLCDLATDELVPHHLEEWSWLPIKTKILHVGAELERGYNPETSLVRSETNKRMMDKYRHYREKQRRRASTEEASTASEPKPQEPVMYAASHPTDPKPRGAQEGTCGSDHDGINNAAKHAHAPLGTQIYFLSVPQTHPVPSQENERVEGSDYFSSKESELALLSQAYTDLIEVGSSQDTAAYLRDIINSTVNTLQVLGLDAAKARKTVSTHLNNHLIQNPKSLPSVTQSAARKDTKVKSVYEVQALIRLESELLRGPTCADPLPQKRIQPVLQLMGKLWLQMTDSGRTSFLQTQMWPYYSAHLPKTLIQIAEAYDLTLPHSLTVDAAAEERDVEDKDEHEPSASPIAAVPERPRISPRRLMSRGSISGSDANPAAGAPKQPLSEAAKRASGVGGSAGGAAGSLGERRSSVGGAGGPGASMFRKLTMRHAVGSKVPKSLTISKKESKKLKRSISGLKSKKETNEGVSMSSSLVRRRTTSSGPQPPTKTLHNAPLAAGQNAYTCAPEMKTPQRRKLASTTILVPETPLTKPAAKVTGDRTGEGLMPPPFDLSSAAAASVGSSRRLAIGHVATSTFTGGEINGIAVGAVLGQKKSFGDVSSLLGREGGNKGKGSCEDFVRGVKEALAVKLGKPQRAPSWRSPVQKSPVRGGISPLHGKKSLSSKGKAPKEEAKIAGGGTKDGLGVSQNMNRLFDEVSCDKSRCSEAGLREALVEEATAAHTNITPESETPSSRRGKGKMTVSAEFDADCVRTLEESLPRSCTGAEEVGDAAHVHADATGPEKSTRKRGRTKKVNKDAAGALLRQGSSENVDSIENTCCTLPGAQHLTEQQTQRIAQKSEECQTDKGSKHDEEAAGSEEAHQETRGSAQKRRKVSDATSGGGKGAADTNPSDHWEVWDVEESIESGKKRKATGSDADGDPHSVKSAVQTKRKSVPPQRLRPSLSNKAYPNPK